MQYQVNPFADPFVLADRFVFRATLARFPLSLSLSLSLLLVMLLTPCESYWCFLLVVCVRARARACVCVLYFIYCMLVLFVCWNAACFLNVSTL